MTVAVGLLKSTQVQIDTATSGEDALALTRKSAYDLILLDQRMPKMDGIETLHRLRSQEDSANLEAPVICLTADAVIGAKERYLAEGFTDYLTKPIDSLALERMLEKYLPDDKVIHLEEGSGVATGPAEVQGMGSGYAHLRSVGVDPAIGLGYCQDDESLYRTLLREFAQGEPDRVSDIARFFDGKDWENYSIVVHSLKSSSKTIGAEGLSELAARLEAAADAGREQDIVAEHNAMLGLYVAVAETIRATMRERGDSDAEAPASDEGEILEFIPDDDDILEFMPDSAEGAR